jgi:hypothetical protein
MAANQAFDEINLEEEIAADNLCSGTTIPMILRKVATMTKMAVAVRDRAASRYCDTDSGSDDN